MASSGKIPAEDTKSNTRHLRPASSASTRRTASATSSRYSAATSTTLIAAPQEPPLSFLGPVGMVRCVSPEEIDGIVHRLYHQAVQAAASKKKTSNSQDSQHQQNGGVADGAAQRPQSALTTTTMSSFEVKESVERLYTAGIRHKMDVHRKLAEKFLFHPDPKRRSKSPLPATELRDHIVQRFYTDERDRHQKRVESLKKTYLDTTCPHVAHRSHQEIDSIVDRLFKSGK